MRPCNARHVTEKSRYQEGRLPRIVRDENGRNPKRKCLLDNKRDALLMVSGLQLEAIKINAAGLNTRNGPRARYRLD
jgi:hypothetical protein